MPFPFTFANQPTWVINPSLRKRLQELLSNALEPTTQRSYKSAFVRFETFAKLYNIDFTKPLTERDLCGYVVYLSMPTTKKPKGLRYTTIKKYISGVRSWCLNSGVDISVFTEDKPLLQRLINALKKMQGGAAATARIPVTLELCSLIKPELNLKLHDHRVLWAMLVTGVRGLLRLGELTHENPTGKEYKLKLLRDENLSTFTTSTCRGFELLLRASKTDLFRETVTVPIFFTGDELCAASALEQMLRGRPASVQKGASTPLFTLANGRILTRPTFVFFLRKLICRVNRKHELHIDVNKVSGHSLRRGGATSMAHAGIPDRIIQLMGRWKSSAYKLYIQTPKTDLYKGASRLRAPKRETAIRALRGSLSKLRCQFNPEKGGLEE